MNFFSTITLAVVVAGSLTGLRLAAADSPPAASPSVLVADGTAFRLVQTDETITIFRGDSTVLVYQKAIVDPPPGVPAVFQRSGFIHPICTPSGVVVTGIHPRDHYHHFGLWHAWVNSRVEGQPVDFWNVTKQSGSVRFSKVLETFSGFGSGLQPHVGFSVEQEHRVDQGKNADPKTALREQLTVTVHMDDDAYLIDYRVTQRNVTDQPIEFQRYRYGGMFGFRASLHWNKTNSRLVTSEGHDRETANSTRARWVLIEGPAEIDAAQTVHVALMGAPTNLDAPQAVRVWNGSIHNGAAFFMFVPVANQAFTLAADEAIMMRYRIRVADGAADTDAITESFNEFE